MKKVTVFLILAFISFVFHSCTLFFNAYLRNLTTERAIVDVYLLDIKSMTTLPNKVKVANHIIKFKSGYKNQFTSSQNVTWINTEHFQFELLSGTTVDLEDMAGEFVNSHPLEDTRVIITTKNKTDTLLNGRHDFRHNLFSYKNKLSIPILYYDAK